jgi:hypothetical protein
MVKTIQISNETHERIKKHGKMGNDMHDVIVQVFNDLKYYKTKSSQLESDYLRLQEKNKKLKEENRRLLNKYEKED